MEQQVIITSSAEVVNAQLRNGWKVISITSNHHDSVYASFCFLLEKN
jgi:hypothetical protein